MPDTGELDELLRRWVAEVTTGSVQRVQRLAGGNRRQAWAVDVATATGVRHLFLRVDPSAHQPAGDPFTLVREALFYRALRHTPVLIPALIAARDDGSAILMERIAGDVALRSLPDARQESLAADLMRALATLHLVDPATSPLGDLAAGRDIGELISADLDLWDELYRITRRPDPLIEFAGQWLRACRPSPPDPVRIVHGDFGPGNFLFSDDRVVALIDWELAHLGDPVEDLAWLSMRSLFDPVPDYAARLVEYERLVGAPVDLDRLRYHRVFVQWRVAIIRHRAHGDSDPGGDVANGLLSEGVNRRVLLEALADAVGDALPGAEPLVARASANAWLFEAALTTLREAVVPRITDPLAAAKAKNVARIVKYLASADSLGDVVDGRERQSLGELLGRPVDDVVTGRELLCAAIRAGGVDRSHALRHFAVLASGESALMAASLGELANRHLPSLTATGTKR